MKVLFLTLLLCVVCAAQEEEVEQSVSEVPGMADLAGGLGVYVCLCVCVCVCVSVCLPLVVFSCGSISQSISLQLNTTPLADSIPVLFGLHHLLCVLIDSHEFFLLL